MRHKHQLQQGSILVEFAVISFVLYLLLGALLSFGTMIQASQVAQDVARIGARARRHDGACVGIKLLLLIVQRASR